MPEKYISPAEFQGPSAALAAGKTGTPEVFLGTPGLKGVDELTFTVANIVAGDTFTVNGVVFTAVASGAVGNQFNVGTSLALSIAALQAVLAASVVAAVASSVYTDTATTLVATTVAYGANTTLATSEVSTAVSRPTVGVALPYFQLLTEHTQLQFGALNGDIMLPDGDESQRKTIAQFGTGTINIKAAHFPTGVHNYAMVANSVLVMQFLAGAWHCIHNGGTTAS